MYNSIIRHYIFTTSITKANQKLISAVVKTLNPLDDFCSVHGAINLSLTKERAANEIKGIDRG